MEGGVAPTENTTNQSQFIPFFTGAGSTTTAGISTQKFVFNPSTTRLGIGLTDPSSTLEINVGTATSALDIQGSAGQLFSVTNNLTSGSIFSVNDVSGIPSIDVDADGTIQLAPFGTTEFVGVGKTNPQAKLDVNGDAVVNGSIGIGTTNPTSKLHIRDDSANANHAVLRLENLQTAGSRTECNIQMWLNNSNANNPGASIGAIENGNDGYADIVFQTTPQSNGSTLGEKARITAGGNVGIGSTIPRSPLDVPGGGAVRLLLSENTTLTGSSVDVTGIPAWATRITILFYRMSAGSTNNFGVRMGTSGGVISSGYDSNSVSESASSNGQASNKFVILNTSASHQLSGRMVIEKLSDSVYTSTHYLSVGSNTSTRSGAGLLESISGTIDRVQMIMTTGTFDNGSFTVYVE